MIFEKQILDSYRGLMHSRCDDNETVFYFSAEDFKDLKKEAYSFKSSLGHDLNGYLYFRDGYKTDKLVIFDHGFGGGHRAYMKEINILTNAGYRVLAYDHTGCMESGGESPNGLTQSLADLDDCVSSVKSDKKLKGVDISVIGHSWGAFSTMNISALHPEISHIVAISGFVSASELIASFFPGILRVYRKAICNFEREANPKYFDYNAVETIGKSDTKALLIYSSNDRLCKKKHYNLLSKALKDKENVSLMLVKGRGHNPNYTSDAVLYLGQFLKARAKLMGRPDLTDKEKKSFVSSFDWNRMTEQDMELWAKILAHLES